MTEKRFELKVNQHNQCDIVDWVESKEKNAICIYNDLGDYHFSSAKALCELLNELHEENQDLATKKEDAEYELLYLKEKYEEVIEENDQLKTQIKIFEKFLNENNLDIDWEIFCTVDECKKDSDDYGCKECKYLGVMWE